MKVCVVGAGIAGLACARVLVDGGASVRILDRGRRVGGRMASRRLDERPVDLGASYLTVSDDDFGSLVDDWCARGLARPWTTTFAVYGDEPKTASMRYGAGKGLRSLAEDLAVDLPVNREITVESVLRTADGVVVDGGPYDAVVLAMPDPQAYRLLDAAARSSLPEPVEFEPVLALAARFGTRPWEHDGMFVNDHPVLAWIADDGTRRGDGAPVLVAHSTGAFAARHLAEPHQAEPELRAALAEVVGVDPVSTYVHRWSFAKPAGSHDTPYALVDGLGICGDAWSDKPRVEAAWLSGRDLGRALLGSDH